MTAAILGAMVLGRARFALIVALAIGAAACSAADPAATTSTTVAPLTTLAPVETTAPPPSTAAPPETTATTTTTTTTTTTLPPFTGLAFEVVATGLDRPVLLVAPPGDPRRFVVERTGRIKIIAPDGTVLPEPFADLRDRVGSNGIEQGLLGLAFHPRYPDDPRFFVYYTGKDDDTRLASLTVSSDDPNRADLTSGKVLLTIEQPTVRHNAGMLEFGPDGYLYVAVGEGGAARANAQNPATLLGSLLRLDVDNGDPYAIPPDNPYADGVDGAPEVWAIGLRNPWRFSIDHPTELLYIADVGQADREEIDVVPLDQPGLNFGWANVEGTMCFFEKPCDPADYVLPVVEYTHEEGCSVTGGYVYRGREIPHLVGHYFYADWCFGWIRSFRYDDGRAVDMQDWSDQLAEAGQVNSFGVDAAGELYVLNWDGDVLRIVMAP